MFSPLIFSLTGSCCHFSQWLLIWFIVFAVHVERPALPNDTVMCPQFYLPHTVLLCVLKPVCFCLQALSL